MKTNSKSIIYWLMASIFYFYEMVLRASTAVLNNDLRESFFLDAAQLGFLSSMYYFAYTPLQIPCGIILDKIGARTVITSSCLVCAFSSCVFGMTESFIIANIARFLIGAGSACAFIGSLTLIMGWFSPRHFSLMAGLTNMMGCIGGIVAATPLSWLSSTVGWRMAMIYLGIAGIILALVTWLVIKDPKKHTLQQTSLFSSLLFIIKKKQIWLLSIMGGLLYLPISAFAELWGVPFLQVVYHIDAEKASLLNTAIYISMGIGAPLGAVFCNYIKNYIFYIRVASCVAAMAFCGVFFANYFSFYTVIGMAGIIGFSLGCELLGFVMATDNAPAALGGSVSAFVNFIIMLFPLVFQPLLGWILDCAWSLLDGAQTNGVPIYTAEMYKYAILIFPICLMLAFFLSMFVKDTYAKHQKEIL